MIPSDVTILVIKPKPSEVGTAGKRLHRMLRAIELVYRFEVLAEGPLAEDVPALEAIKAANALAVVQPAPRRRAA